MMPRGMKRARSRDDAGTGRPRIGVRDVARAAGVSTATVSRAFNSPELVGPELTARVLGAAERLGYLPDNAARSLSLRRTYRLGAIIPTIDNALFARGIDAFQKRAAASGYSVLLATTDYDVRQERDQVHNLVTAGAEGLMFMGETHLPEVYRLLQSRRVAYVNTGVYRPGSEHPSVGFDNREAAMHATRFLLSLGHRRIGMIAGIRKENDRATNRVIGVRDALAERGLDLPDAWLVERPYDTAAGRDGFRLLMQRRPRPTAILCGNDVLGFGALLEAPRIGVDIPGDVSVVGFDDLDLASHLQPTLTTMRVPTDEMGRRAADYLIGCLGREPVMEATRIDVSLVARDSTAPPPVD